MVFETDHDDVLEPKSGWNLTEAALTSNSISYSYENSQYGVYVVGINGIEAPEYGTVSDEDYWYWGVYVWNETEESWDFSNVGLSSVMIEDSPHVAIAASNADASLLPTPEDDHDDHDDHSGHDGHDAHDDHKHAEAEISIENPVGCPLGTVISVFHLEEGEYVVEFETNWWARTSFDMAAMKMMGGHAHHHHDHGHGEDGHDEDGHDDNEPEFTSYWVGYETANWSCNWEDTADPGEEETAYYWSCDDIRDPPEDTGDNDWYYCEYYDDIATYYCTNGFSSQGTDENGEWGNSASFTHWRDGGDPHGGGTACDIAGQALPPGLF